MAKPFLKWAGGKQQLLPALRERFPAHVSRYCEPFLGGGAVLFDLLSRKDRPAPEATLVNDVNPDLTNTYIQLRDRSAALIERLASLQGEYWGGADEQEQQALYLALRARYVSLQALPVPSASDDARNSLQERSLARGQAQEEGGEATAHLLEKAALFIYLNKTCFNGLYRVNSRGAFNVPFGKRSRPRICDEDNLLACSQALQGVRITTGPFDQCLDFIDAQTFVYLDPPYRPLSETAAFTKYSAAAFGDKDQRAVQQFAVAAAAKGARVLLSNSDPKNTDPADEFFDELYTKALGFSIERVTANRTINSNSAARGRINEILVSI